MKSNKLEALSRHTKKCLTNDDHLIQYIAFSLQKELLFQSSAKPQIPRIFEFIKNNGMIYGVNCF